MFKKTLPALALTIMLAACGISPEAKRKPGIQSFDWPGEGVRATLEYRTVQAPPAGTTCAGSLRIENHGKRNYSVLLFNVKAFSASGELIATDRFSLSSSLNPGGRAEIAFDPHNPLNPVVLTKRYSECPKDMASLDVKLEAF